MMTKIEITIYQNGRTSGCALKRLYRSLENQTAKVGNRYRISMKLAK